MGKFWKLNHTADLAIRVEAETIEDLFITYAQAMFETIIDGEIRKSKRVKFDLDSHDLKELLLDWLRELLYLFESQGYIPSTFNLKIKDKHLSAIIDGDTYDPEVHTAQLEIKVPTYHQFKLEKKNNHWDSLIIFDI